MVTEEPIVGITSGTDDRPIPSCDLTPGEPPPVITREHSASTQPCLKLLAMRLTWQSHGRCTAQAAAAS